MAVTTQQVAELYVATFNRAPDAAGLAYWISDGTSATTTLTDINAIARAMQAGAEAESGVGSMTNTEYVISLYSSMFGRTVTAADAGVTYWVDQMTAGSVDRANLIQTLIAGAQASTGSATDAAMLANKTTVGLAFAAAGLNNVTDATSVLSGVTADAATVTAAQTTIDQLVSPVQALTTSADTVVGTVHNDTITATSATLGTNDVIIDQSSTDNDTLNVTLTTAMLVGTHDARVSGIENININWNAFGTATVEAGNFTGATITGTSSKTGFLGSMTVNGAGDNTVVAGSGMVGTLTVADGTSVTVDGGAARTLIVNGTGTAADDLSATVTAGANTTSVTVGTTNAFKTTTVDAGTATTISIADQGAATNTTTLTVGASAAITLNNTGSTTLNVNAADVTSSLTLTAIGEGLTIAGAQSTTINATAAGYSTETITNALTAGTLTAEINGAVGADTDLSNIGADLFVIDTAFGADKAVAVASGSSINADVNLGANGEFGVLTADDSATDELTITNSVATQTMIQVDGASAFVGDIETLNLISAAAAVTGTDATYTNILATTADVILTGTNDVSIGNIKSVSLDASGLTGDLTATSTFDAAFTVLGSTGTNNITFAGIATGDSSFTGQNGNDTVAFVNTSTNATAILGNGTNTVTAGTTSGSLVVVGGDGVDTVTATSVAGTGTGEVNLDLGAGNDVVTLATNGTNDVVTIDAGAGNDSVEFKTSNSSASDVYTLAFGEGTDTMTITSVDLSAGTWTVSGLEKIAIGSSSTAAIVDASFLNNKSYTITGDGTIGDHLAVTTATAGTYSFNSLVIDQTITKGLSGLDITGSAGIDIVTGTTGADTFALGAGANVLTIGQADSGITATSCDYITDWTAATYALHLGAAADATANTGNYVEVADADLAGNFTNILAAGNAALATLAGTSSATQLYAVVGDTDAVGAVGGAGAGAGADLASYLFNDFDGDGVADQVIVLFGVATTTISAADIIA